MEFITSKGGPLICLESTWKASWGGIEWLTVASVGAKTDYDRACEPADYTAIIPVGAASALVLSAELKAETSIWRQAPDDPLVIVRCPAQTRRKEEAYLTSLPQGLFSDPIASVGLSVASGRMVLFDSAEPGDNTMFPSISFRIDPGHWRILLQTYDPGPEISFLLQKFEPFIEVGPI